MSPSNPRLRTATTNDLPRLREIVAEAFDGVSIDQAIEQRFGVVGNVGWRTRKAGVVDSDFARERDGVLVAEIDGDVVGVITSWHDPASSVGVIPNVAVAAAHRGLGIGRLLLNAVLDRFRGLGIEVVRIETLTQNDVGDHLYRELGFEEVARQIHFAMRLAASDR